MPRRTRSAKQLGTRHDLNYFKRWTRSRAARLALSIALPLVVIGWLAVANFRGEQTPYTSGPLARPHNVFANQCDACHVRTVGGVKTTGFKNNATDEACLACHRAPQHDAMQATTPACSTCHVEHVGADQLTTVLDSNCVQCHADLRLKDGSPPRLLNVADFGEGHPEAEVLRNKRADPATLAFNHLAHMKTGLASMKGPVTLQCADCHAPAPSSPATAGQPERPAAMAPVSYEKHCAACHTLQFDARIPKPAPHAQPEQVEEFVRSKFAELAEVRPGATGQQLERPRSLPGAQTQATASGGDAVEQATTLLFRGSCKLCHQVTLRPGAPASIAPVQISARWMPRAQFNHHAHRAFGCRDCHEQAATSKLTSDVLLPSMNKCQSCHAGEATRPGVAESRCSTCHSYHDWGGQHAERAGWHTLPFSAATKTVASR